MIDKKEILKAYNFRHACKVFDKDKKISKEDFDTILETGRLSPSSFGFEPWKFLVVQDMAHREKLMPVTWGAQGTLPTASHFIIILSRKEKSMHYNSDYITHMMYDVHHLEKEQAEGRRGYYEAFQKNDFKLLGNERAMVDWASKQTYIALANMMITAAMLGIDSCPIEGFQREELETIMIDVFGMDSEEFEVSVMVAFGYRANPQNKKTRQPKEEIVEWL